MRAKSRILVIDGDERMLAAVRSFLIGARYDVAVAASGNARAKNPIVRRRQCMEKISERRGRIRAVKAPTCISST